MDEDLIRIRIEELLKTYVGLPNFDVVRDSIVTELMLELNDIDTNELNDNK